jgi:NAD dependent epimerase/dehydratase family enzyme
VSWIALDDLITAYLHAMRTDSLRGPANGTAPKPVTMNDFVEALGRAVHRPTMIPTPLTPLRALYGSELVEHVLLAGQRAVPRALEASGFTFRHETLEDALRAVLG